MNPLKLSFNSYKSYNLKLFKLFFLFALLFILGCGAPEKKFPDMVWPLPPEEPKVKFVDIFQTDADVREPSFLSALFGEEVGNALIKPYGVAVDKAGRIYVTDLEGSLFLIKRTSGWTLSALTPAWANSGCLSALLFLRPKGSM